MSVEARLWQALREVEEVRIEIVWDPVWTRKMIREEARETMRGLGIVA